MKKVRFRTLGCYPLTGGIESDAETLDEIIDETLSSVNLREPHVLLIPTAELQVWKKKERGVLLG